VKSTCLVMALVIAAAVEACQTVKSGTSPPHVQKFASAVAPANTKPDFDSDIKPIFQSRCMPCHFQGGKVYEKLPFDKPETITKLGTKLFTRIKDEKEQRLIREFLAAQ
jgi:hypothetical protein